MPQNKSKASGHTSDFWKKHSISSDKKPSGLKTLAQSGRKYVHDRAMDGTRPGPKVASDNTRVTPKKR